MATISIKKLRVDTIIGIYPHELKQKQPLIFDVDMQCSIDKVAETDRITDALDYAAVAQRIETMVESNDKKLLEGLIKNIAEALIEEFRLIEHLSITVRKPQAIANAAYSSIAYQLSRN